MPLVSLRDLYITELSDLYDAEQQLLRELPLMAAHATSQPLREALDAHYRQTHLHVERLELLFRLLDERPLQRSSAALRGIAETARARHADTERGDVLDAALIASAQRIEHYEMAAYRCVRMYAATLGDAEAARILQQTLDEEGDTDHLLTRLAEHGINQAAGEDLVQDPTRYRSRLRYVALQDLPHFTPRVWQVVSSEQDTLGTLDGFIVESQLGRPLYVVVDSGGWFVGRRYVVPVGQLDANENTGILRTELDREALARYPEFSPGAFLSMTDAEAARYEDRLLKVVAPERAMTRRARQHDDPLYRAPNWPMTGVWMTETSDLSTVPPRADTGAPSRTAESSEEAERTADTYPAQERVAAHAEPERPDRGTHDGS